MKKTAVWNDLRNHREQKEIHLKAERWVPVRDFSYTSQDRQKSSYWKYYTHCLSASFSNLKLQVLISHIKSRTANVQKITTFNFNFETRFFSCASLISELLSTLA